jgi:hypothetical protein
MQRSVSRGTGVDLLFQAAWRSRADLKVQQGMDSLVSFRSFPEWKPVGCGSGTISDF